MAAGDVTNPKRVRLEANERLDQVDADFVSKQARLMSDAQDKAVLFAPPATAGVAVGEILTGGSLTPNPTSGSDGKLRFGSELFVALDSDGRFMVKPSGTSIDVTIPAGGAQYQIYAYLIETTTDTAKRRGISVSSPFLESTRVMDTTFIGTLGLYVRSGGIGSVVPTDTVSGLAQNLVFLGIASNTAGAVTFDGSAATSRLSTIRPTSSRPSSAAGNASFRTLHGHVVGVGYELARTKFKDQGGISGSAANVVTGAGSNQRRVSGLVGMTVNMVGQTLRISGAASAGNNGYFTISSFVNGTTVDVFNPQGVTGDANNGAITWSLFAHNLPGVGSPAQQSTNFGAYTEPRHSLDFVDRALQATVTIGDGVSTFGTFDTSEFADGSACLQAALNLLCSQGGGRVVFKAGATVTLVSDVLIPTNAPVVFEGNGATTALDGGSSFKITSSNGALSFRNLTISGIGTVIKHSGSGDFLADNCTFNNTGSPSPSILVDVASIANMKSFVVSRCSFLMSASGGDAATTVAAISIPYNIAVYSNVVIDRSTFKISGNARRVVSIDAAITNGNIVTIKVLGSTFEYLSDAAEFGTQPAFLYIANAATGVKISNCDFRGNLSGSANANYRGVSLVDVDDVTISDCAFDYVAMGIRAEKVSGTKMTGLVVSGCRFSTENAVNQVSCLGLSIASGLTKSSITGCVFSSNWLSIAGSFSAGVDVASVGISNCRFQDTKFQVIANTIGYFGSMAGNPGDGLSVVGCSFFSSAADLLAPQVIANTTDGVIHATWNDNSHTGFFSLTSDTHFGVKFQAHEVELAVSNNRFHSIEANVTWTGANTPHRIIEIDATIHSWLVTGNVAQRVGDNLVATVGVNDATLYFVDASSKDRSTDASTILYSCVLSDNVVGGVASDVSLFSGAYFTGGLKINSLVVRGNSTASDNVMKSAGLRILLVGSLNESLIIDGNTWRPGGSSPTDWFVLEGSATINSVHFTNNSVVATTAFTSNKGVKLDWNVNNLIFHLNTAGIPNTSTNPVMWISLGGTIGASFEAAPGSGVNWPGNLKIRQA